MNRRYPAGHVFYRNLHVSFPLIETGKGIFLYDSEGKEYIDGSGGAAVVNIGHGVKEVADAISRQARKAAYLNGLQFTHEPVERLAAEIAEFLPFPEGKLYFLTSGSEAVEASIKFARQYWVETGKGSKSVTISRTPSYHGNTLGALSLSARKHYQETFQPLLMESPKIPAPYCYRCYCGLAYPRCGLACARELDTMIAKLGRDKVSAFLLEVIGGATTGAAVPPAEYFKVVREICDQNDVLLIADEVMTGIGRTGKWLAGQHFNLIPDLIVMGKGLTGGYVPMSALAAPKKHVDVIFDKKKSFLHAQTFAHHPVGCAAGLATLKYLKKNKLVEKSAKLGRRLLKSIAGLQKYPHVGDVRGQGLFVGVEFVQDKKTRKPFPRAMKYAENFSRVAMEKGLVLWSNVGQADGTNGDLVLLAPPLIITEEEIDLIREKMDDILSEMGRSFHS